jgi:hypothetical protein
MALVVTIAFFPSVKKGIGFSHLDLRPLNENRAPVLEWVKRNAPDEAIFAVPPSWKDFRLIAERPMVVDYRSIPRYAPDRKEWLERIRALTLVERPGPDSSELDTAFGEMDCERAQAIRDSYGASFAILPRDNELSCGRLAYVDEWFGVWELAAD